MTAQEISVLLVGDQCSDVETLLRHTRWAVRHVSGVQQAREQLRSNPVQVVLCKYSLRDGSWMDVLSAAEMCDPPPAVVVLAAPDDRIWSEVVSNGAYDLLPVPCTAPELYAIVPMAWRHFAHQEYAHRAAV